MRSCFVLLFASLLTSCEAQGTIETPVFVLKGRDLLLELHADPPEGVLYVDWKIKKTVDLVRFDPSGKANVLHNVTGRFEFPENKFSVILKNLQEADSGVYSAVAVTPTGDKLVAEYKVTVQGPVSPVKLTVQRMDSSSSESCDLHVTCRTHNSHTSSTFKCVDRVCSQEGGERSEVTTSGASLQLYLLNNVIICDHRNKVHWTQDLIHAEPLCSSKPDPHHYWRVAILFLTGSTFSMIMVLFFWFHHQRRIIRVEGTLKNTALPVLLDVASAPPQDKISTNISVEPHPESKSLGTTTQTVVQPLLSSDQHETHQSNIKRPVPEPPQNCSPADAAGVGRRFNDLVRAVLQEELELLNKTSISSSFVKPDAGSIQPESGFGREDSL